MSKLNINVQDQVKCINDRLEDIKLLVSEIENDKSLLKSKQVFITKPS